MRTITISERKGTIVSTAHVNELVSTYKKERWLQNSQKIGKPDSLSTWYEIEALQSFLQNAEKNGADGIKMFFGVYPADYPNELMAGRQTVVLVATRKAVGHTGARNKLLFIKKENERQLLAFNKGDTCPPFCYFTMSDNSVDLSIELDLSGDSIMDIEYDM